MHYNTRVMVALTDFPHGRDYIRKDQQFVATEIDAEYLNKHKRAAYAPEKSAAAPALAPVAPPAPAPAPAPVEPPAPAPAPAVAESTIDVSSALGEVSAVTTADLPAAVTAVEAPTAAAAAPAPVARRGRAARNTPASE